MRESDAACLELPRTTVVEFIQRRFKAYTVCSELPSKRSAIEDAFRLYSDNTSVEQDVLRQGLRLELLYKPGHTIAKCGSRKRSNVSVYIKDGVVMTIKPSVPLAFPSTSAASSSRSPDIR